LGEAKNCLAKLDEAAKNLDTRARELMGNGVQVDQEN